MARPTEAQIEALYVMAENGGLTRAEVDAFAGEVVGVLLGGRQADELSDVRSNRELDTIADKVRVAGRRKSVQQSEASEPVATPRQIDYILTLLAQRERSGEGGGFFQGPTGREDIARLTRREASTYITSLKGDY